MTDDPLIRFRIPAEFVARHGLPTATELAYGYGGGWLLREDVVAIALRKYEVGLPLRDAEEALALLLSDDIGRVDDLVDELRHGDQPEELRARYWLFLALAWLREHPDLAEDPLQAIELLYADFGYPAEIDMIVRSMPPSPGERTGLAAMRKRWTAYVDDLTSEYRHRQDVLMGVKAG
jgi:hypothetical protein